MMPIDASLGVEVAQVALLCGIFMRLGSLNARIESLESWKATRKCN